MSLQEKKITILLIYFQTAVAETYKAMSNSPRSPHIGPVVMSELARRRTLAKPGGPTKL